MRARLRGINRFRTRLADGRTVTYYYAWKGGPRLAGEPGTPEFHASYVEAHSNKRPRTSDTLSAILEAFQNSADFRDNLAQRTRADYTKKIQQIDKKFGDLPLAALTDRRTRGIFMEWRDDLARTSRRQADYTWVVLARILSWALDRGLVLANPCEKGGRLYRGSRVDKIWTEADEAAFLAHAPGHLHLPLLLALWTGLRQGDLLRLSWSAYDGTHIRVRTSKTGRRLVIRVGAPLKSALDTTPRQSPIILVNSDGQPWKEDGFRSSWRKACAVAGVIGVTFNDLRGTAVTRLALVGCTEAEIVSITGHSLRDVGAILDAHYLHRDPALADSAIHKLERATKETETGTHSPK